MILLVIVSVVAGYIVGISINAKTRKRHFVNYNTDLRRLALEACINWQAQTNVSHSMLKLSKFLSLKNETEKQTFN